LLFSHTVLCRDLKPENILLTSDWKVKLTDFGESRDFSNGSTDAERNGQVSDTKGTWAFWAPEMCDDEDDEDTDDEEEVFYSAYAADVWAAGVTLYAMLFGVLPFWGVDCDDQFKKILATRTMDRVECPSDRSAEFVELLNWMLAPDPSNRKSCEECESAPWIQLYSNPELEKSLKHASSMKVDSISKSHLDVDGTDPEALQSTDKEEEPEIILRNGHEWHSKYLTKPTWCRYCSSFIWGVTKEMQNSMKCKCCRVTAHRKCCIEDMCACDNSKTASVKAVSKAKSSKWSVVKEKSLTQQSNTMADAVIQAMMVEGESSLDHIENLAYKDMVNTLIS
jgi:serine/threonine protein kinase